MRTFSTGAKRNEDKEKIDYEGSLSPRVLERYGEFKVSNRVQADGTRRNDDNWQLGIPIESYRKSLIRHVFQAWKIWRGGVVLNEKGEKVDIEEALCAVLFNTQGMLHEILKQKDMAKDKENIKQLKDKVYSKGEKKSLKSKVKVEKKSVKAKVKVQKKKGK